MSEVTKEWMKGEYQITLPTQQQNVLINGPPIVTMAPMEFTVYIYENIISEGDGFQISAVSGSTFTLLC